MPCILEDGRAEGQLQEAIDTASELGMSLPPFLTGKCDHCGMPHPLQVPEGKVANLAGQPRFETPPTKADLEPRRMTHDPYCTSCASYHSGACRRPGRAVSLPNIRDEVPRPADTGARWRNEDTGAEVNA